MRLPEIGIMMLLLVAVDAFAQPVFVSGDEDGQGFLRQRGDDCYLITPQHVLRQVRSVEFVGDRAEHHRASLVRAYDADLAILRVESDVECSDRFPDGGALDRLLIGTTRAHLVSRSASGAIRRIGVEIVASDERFIRVRPANNGEQLFRGMSGSLLMIGGTTAGMLQSVDSQSGVGTVLRQDHLGSILASWFVPSRVHSTPYISNQVIPVIETNDAKGLISDSGAEHEGTRPVLDGGVQPARPLPTGKDKDN